MCTFFCQYFSIGVLIEWISKNEMGTVKSKMLQKVLTLKQKLLENNCHFWTLTKLPLHIWQRKTFCFFSLSFLSYKRPYTIAVFVRLELGRKSPPPISPQLKQTNGKTIGAGKPWWNQVQVTLHRKWSLSNLCECAHLPKENWTCDCLGETKFTLITLI